MTEIRARDVRRIVLEQSHRAHVGHIGSALSVADILAAAYGGGLTIPSPRDPERDRFVLSKGHAALALYAVFFLKGWISQSELDSYCGEGSRLAVHPERCLEGVDFSSGALGHGLSVGAGAALAARAQKSVRRVAVLLSDGECNEGSVWEAAMFAAHQRLSNLTVIVDLNGQQALGYTKQVLSLDPLVDKWKTFGWDARDVDGHKADELRRLIALPAVPGGPPRALVARTVFGKGVPYMESKIKWHYSPMSEAEYREALEAVRTMP